MLLMRYDKQCARQRKRRVPERAKFIREELGITRNKAEWLAPELQEGAKVLAQFDMIMKGMR